LIALGYVLMLGAKVFAGFDPYGGGDTTSVVVIDSTAIALAAFLGWRVHARQPVWASVVLLLWAMLETAGKIALMTDPYSSFQPNVGSLFINVVGLVAGVLSVRGALKLSAFRKVSKQESVRGDAQPPPAELVFWQSIQQSTNAAEYDAYIEKFPDGYFRSIAATRAASLRGQSSTGT
jgi:hypothetical protein